MATKQIWHDIDGVKVSILKDWKHNPLTTALRTTLGGTLNGSHTALQCFDTDLLQNFYWSGSAWISGTAPIAGAMSYKGAHTDLVNAPAGTSVGDTYIINANGTLTWAGITFSPNAVVQAGDLAIKRDATNWDIVQGNAVQSTETVSGISKVATQALVTAGTNDTDSVTPLKLATHLSNIGVAKTYFASAISLAANTAFTVTHNLNLQNKDAFVISVKDSAGSEVGVDVDSTSVNALTITSSIVATNVTVMVIGR